MESVFHTLDLLSFTTICLLSSTKNKSALTLLVKSSTMSTEDYESSDNGHGMREEDAEDWAVLLKGNKEAGTPSNGYFFNEGVLNIYCTKTLLLRYL